MNIVLDIFIIIQIYKTTHFPFYAYKIYEHIVSHVSLATLV